MSPKASSFTKPALSVFARSAGVAVLAAALAACAPDPDRPPREDARYDLVFREGEVGRVDLTVAASDWAAMLADMTEMLGPFGERARGPLGPGDVLRVDGGVPSEPPSLVGGGPPDGGPTFPFDRAPDGGAPPDDREGELLPRTPLYVPATISIAGATIQNVGLRLKGNSTLSSTWARGSHKLPFRLHADKLEDRFPQAKDQRILGFQLLNLTSNADDDSFLREALTADLLREAGVRAARTAFVRVTIDHGQGPVYFGLYTLVEVPDQPFLRAQFGSDDGNLYKPQGKGARLVAFDEASFEKKTNEPAADFGDVRELVAALNGPRGDAAAWRRRLEAAFDVPGFLRWFAANTTIGNFDTYGGLAHNYYLYGDPGNGKRLTWIPWDHNLALHAVGALSLLHERTDESWPLIRFLLDDAEYRRRYLAEIEAFLGGPFDPTRLGARLRAGHALVRPHVVGTDGERPTHTTIRDERAFEEATDELLGYVEARAREVRAALEAARR